MEIRDRLLLHIINTGHETGGDPARADIRFLNQHLGIKRAELVGYLADLRMQGLVDYTPGEMRPRPNRESPAYREWFGGLPERLNGDAEQYALILQSERQQLAAYDATHMSTTDAY